MNRVDKTADHSFGRCCCCCRYRRCSCPSCLYSADREDIQRSFVAPWLSPVHTVLLCRINNIYQSNRGRVSLLLTRKHRFCRAMPCIARPIPSFGICPSVRPSRSCILSQRIRVQFFSASASHTILLFFIPNVMAVFRREPH